MKAWLVSSRLLACLVSRLGGTCHRWRGRSGGTRRWSWVYGTARQSFELSRRRRRPERRGRLPRAAAHHKSRPTAFATSSTNGSILGSSPRVEPMGGDRHPYRSLCRGRLDVAPVHGQDAGLVPVRFTADPGGDRQLHRRRGRSPERPGCVPAGASRLRTRQRRHACGPARSSCAPHVLKLRQEGHRGRRCFARKRARRRPPHPHERARNEGEKAYWISRR